MPTQTGSLDLKGLKQTYNKTIAVVQPIYCRTNSSTAPAASTRPTTVKITKTDDTGTTAPSSNGNGWTTMLMARICSSDFSYKYLWTCQQLLAADGTVLGCTSIVEDKGTTIIDGDTITTGKVNTARLNVAGVITAINDDSTTTINGGKITTGSIVIGKLDTAAQNTIASAATTASNYITNIDSNGIWVTPSGKKPTNTSTGAGATGTRINGDGMEIYKDSSKIAEFKSYINLGSSNTNTVNNNPLDRTATIGTGLVANKAGQMVLGNYNTANSNALFIIGNGSGHGYTETSDRTYNSAKTYYTYNSNTGVYSKFTGTSFINGTTYYESKEKNAFTVESILNTTQKEVFEGGESEYTLSHSSDDNKDNASAYDLYGTQLTANKKNDTTVHITSGTITSGDSIEINYSYLNSANESVTTQEFYTATTNNQKDFTVLNTISSLTSVYNKSVPASLTISDISGSTITLSASSTSGHRIQINYICTEDDSYVKISNSDSVLGAYSLTQGDAIATGDAAHAFGIYTFTGTMTASGIGSSAQGHIFESGTMTASGAGSSAQGFVYAIGTMTASGAGSSAQGYVDSGIMTASGESSFAQGRVFSGTMVASGPGSFTQGHVGSGTMTASATGSSAQGYVDSGIMEAYNYGTSVQGYVDSGTMKTYGRGSSAQGYVGSGTMETSNYGTSVQGYVGSGTMRASGNGSSVQGYVDSGTMIASGAGAMALNEGTHAMVRAQLVIGTYNAEDSGWIAQTTIHPSGIKRYGTYAFIIGNGTDEYSRSNAFTVDWSGKVNADGRYTVNGWPLLTIGTVSATIKVDSTDHTIGTAKTGYTAIGIVGWDWSGTGTATCYMNRLSLNSSGNVVVNAYRAAGSVDATLEVNVLYIATAQGI